MALLDKAKLTSGIVLALTACSTASVHGGSSSGGSGGAVGHGGAGATTSSTVATSTTGVTTGAGGANTGGSGGSAPADGCNPPPDAATLWAQKALTYPDYQETTLCAYTGQVLLVVNTAAA